MKLYKRDSEVGPVGFEGSNHLRLPKETFTPQKVTQYFPGKIDFRVGSRGPFDKIVKPPGIRATLPSAANVRLRRVRKSFSIR